MTTESTNWNTQEWNESEVLFLIDELNKYWFDNNKKVFFITEGDDDILSIGVTVSKKYTVRINNEILPINRLKKVWEATLNVETNAYEVKEIDFFAKIIKDLNENSIYFSTIANIKGALIKY